jgi:hypothetical protein
MIGGATYEEARTVAMFNQDPVAATNGAIPAGSNTRLLLGGTSIHNSTSFLDLLRVSAPLFPASVYEPPPEAPALGNSLNLNLNLGGVNVQLGGPAGTGVYRTSGEGMSVQADGIRDGVRSFMDKVKQGVDRLGNDIR